MSSVESKTDFYGKMKPESYRTYITFKHFCSDVQ